MLCALFASKAKILKFSSGDLHAGNWSEEFFLKNIDFSLWGDYATTPIHIIDSTSFPFLASCATTLFFSKDNWLFFLLHKSLIKRVRDAIFPCKGANKTNGVSPLVSVSGTKSRGKRPNIAI